MSIYFIGRFVEASQHIIENSNSNSISLRCMSAQLLLKKQHRVFSLIKLKTSSFFMKNHIVHFILEIMGIIIQNERRKKPNNNRKKLYKVQ